MGGGAIRHTIQLWKLLFARMVIRSLARTLTGDREERVSSAEDAARQQLPGIDEESLRRWAYRTDVTLSNHADHLSRLYRLAKENQRRVEDLEKIVERTIPREEDEEETIQ